MHEGPALVRESLFSNLAMVTLDWRPCPPTYCAASSILWWRRPWNRNQTVALCLQRMDGTWNLELSTHHMIEFMLDVWCRRRGKVQKEHEEYLKVLTLRLAATWNGNMRSACKAPDIRGHRLCSKILMSMCIGRMDESFSSTGYDVDVLTGPDLYAWGPCDCRMFHLDCERRTIHMTHREGC